MEEVETPPISVLVCHELVEPADSEWSGDNCVAYHSYFFRDSHDLQNAKAFDYGGSKFLGSRKAALFLEKNLEQQNGESDGESVTRNESYKASRSEISDSKLSAFMMEVGNVSRDD